MTKREKAKYDKKYRQENKERIAAYQYQYVQSHRERLIEQHTKQCAQRRAKYMEGKSCPHCGTTENLALHHLDPNLKNPLLENGGGTLMWRWSEERRNKELKKCIVVCRSCHAKIHNLGKGGKENRI